MRFIDPRRVAECLPVGWCDRAKEADNAVEFLPVEERSAEVSRRSGVWQELKETFREISYQKCWYCESKEIRSDNAIDHFRPKNAVAECPGHSGYWWLAFRWRNYRFCCTFCNCRRIDQEAGRGGGKADHFPLADEGNRAKTPMDALEDEEPVLLDPMIPADPGFLWFDETGRATPNPACAANTEGYAYSRATESIRLYHLNHTDLVEARKDLCSELRDALDKANRYFQKYDAGDRTGREAFENEVRALRERVSERAEYSAMARAMLMGARGSYPFVDVVLAA